MLGNLRARAGTWPDGLRPRTGDRLGDPAVSTHRWRFVNVALLAVAVAAGVAAYLAAGTKSTAQAQVTTGNAQRGSVLSTVSASGNVQPAGTLVLNFSGTGQLAAVYVELGQYVRKGQSLARLDDTSEAAAVRTARASLESAQANLVSLQHPLTAAVARQNQVAVAQAKSAITTQNTSLHDTQTQAGQDRASLQRAVDQQRVALRQAQKASSASAVSLRNSVGESKGAWLEAQAASARDATDLQTAIDQANAQLARDQAQLGTDQNSANTSTSQVSNATGGANDAQSRVGADNDKVAADKQKQHKDKCDLANPPQPKCANDAYQLSQDQAQLTNDQGQLSSAQADQKTAQSSLDSANAAVSSDQTKITGDQTAVTNAQSGLTAGQLKDKQSVNQAYRAYVNAKQAQKSGLQSNQQSVQGARNALDDAVASENAGVAKDDQSVHGARASLQGAHQSLSSTLASNAAKSAPPTSGQLASARAQIVSANVGLANALAAERQMTLVAPAAGRIAVVNGAVGEAPGGATSGSSTSSGFITVVDLGRPEVLASFSESDVAKIRRGEPATIAVDALPNVELAAHVIGIDTTQTVVNNVVTYGVTLLLDRTAPGLKPGMTVNASVIAAKRDGVIHVPNAAVHTTGGASTVTVVGANGAQSQQPVQVGLVGDESTEIVSGLRAGDQVVVSTLSSTLTTTTPTVGGGRGGGGGGFRFGAGGAGLGG